MFCINCGNKIPENDVFCVNCGQKIDVVETQSNFAQTETTNEVAQPDSTQPNSKLEENQVVEKKGLMIAGFVLGILGILFFPLGILGLIFSGIAYFKNKQKLALAGIIISVLGIVRFLLLPIFWF